MFREYREIIVGNGRVNFNANFQENSLRIVVWTRTEPTGAWELAGERRFKCWHLTKLLRQLGEVIPIDEEPLC